MFIPVTDYRTCRGELASHLVGKGRMEEPDKIIEVLGRLLFAQKDLEKKDLNNSSSTYER